jgi:hypothetical protein
MAFLPPLPNVGLSAAPPSDALAITTVTVGPENAALAVIELPSDHAVTLVTATAMTPFRRLAMFLMDEVPSSPEAVEAVTKAAASATHYDMASEVRYRA